jgi:hypothetical protein
VLLQSESTHDMNSPYGDIPFPVLKSNSPLADALELHGLSRNVTLKLDTCHISVSERSWTFHSGFLAFIRLLCLLNTEITQTCSKEKKTNQIYWTSLRVYLNNLLENTLTALSKNQRPMALGCWLHREFMLCTHDESGRREYHRLMEKNGIQPYSTDIFELGE